MASEFEKPDKVHTLFPEEIPKKMWPLPVKELFMVGRATASKLHKMGIFTIGALASSDPKLLQQWFKSYGLLMWNFANGYEDSPVRDDGYPMKGLGNSTTVPFDVEDKKTAHMVLLSLSETVAMRLRDAKKCARVVSVSIKNKDFHSYSHQGRFDIPADSTNAIFQRACQLFDQSWQGEPIRHMGLRLSQLCSNDFHQLSIFEPNRQKNSILDQTVDRIRLKYGSHSIMRSCFLYSGISPLMGGVLEDEDYPIMSSIL